MWWMTTRWASRKRLVNKMTNELEPMANEELQETEKLQENDELVSLLEQRAATYAFIARIFRTEIDKELLDEMHGMLYPRATGDENVDKGNLYIATYLPNLWADSLEELAQDFTRTFTAFGAEAYSAAFPYESVYTSEKRLLMQAARDEVLAVYRAYGIDKGNWTESEDHIALELEFMQILSERAAEALRKGNDDGAFDLLVAQRNFVEDHLVSWVPMMTADMHKYAKTKMYQGPAYLAEGFLDTDYAFLKDLLVEE